VSYKLGIKELDDTIGNIKAGSNIMLLGPPMSGKTLILNHIIYSALENNEAIILVSTKEIGEHVFQWFEQQGMSMERYKERFGIVDCISKAMGLYLEDTPSIKYASSMDLTSIGVKISVFFEEFWKKAIRNIRLCINSLSTILMYSNLQTTYRFLHIFTGRIKLAKTLGIYILEEGAHDEQALSTLKQLFSSALEIKKQNDSYYIRGVGFSKSPSKWLEYEVEGGKIIIKEC
jgi:KaiC/GvpD/RAD55 family RecA-like ATPase